MVSNKPEDKPVARHLLMKLLGSRPGIRMNAASAVRVGALFGISENNIRVTLTRLQSANLLELVERGYYVLGESGKQFAADIGRWREVEASLCEWEGDWIGVLTNALAKSDRKAKRTQQRAMKLMGMKALSADFYVRPNNFINGADEVRTRFNRLGLDPKAIVFNASHFDRRLSDKALGLWQTQKLEDSYKEGLQNIERSMKVLPNLSQEAAAQASFFVGDEALKRLVFDPLLPTPLVNVELRKTFRNAVKEYDALGASIWLEFLQISQG